MKVLVTGGAGFIGHHLVHRLLDRGDDVTVIDDLSSGNRSHVDTSQGPMTFIENTVLDPSALDEAASGCDVIFHQAAIASVARSVAEPRVTNEVNVGGTIEVVLAAARQHVRRIVFASSSAVYGMAEGPCRESQRAEPQSPYGASKLAAEHYLHALSRLSGVETVALRYFNVFGPGQDPASEYAAVVPRFINAVLGGGTPVVNGSGKISRDFVYVDNVVDANLLAASPSSPSGITFNVAGGRQETLFGLLRAICDAAGREVAPLIGPPRAGDIPRSWADISEARRALGYEPSVSFREGLARTVAWYRALGPVTTAE